MKEEEIHAWCKEYACKGKDYLFIKKEVDQLDSSEEDKIQIMVKADEYLAHYQYALQERSKALQQIPGQSHKNQELSTLNEYRLSQPAFLRLALRSILPEGSFFNLFKAMCLAIAKFSSACPFRTLESSSLKATSKTQCTLFSMPQWLCTPVFICLAS